MKNVMIAPVGDHIENLFVSLRDFPAEKIYLLCTQETKEITEQAVKDLDRFKMKTILIEMKNDIWEEMFKHIAEIRDIENENCLIVNTSTGNRMMQSAATSAAFVNGLKAISVDNEEAHLLPVLKFSYYKLLTDKKMEIMKELADENCCASLEELSQRLNMSMPLMSYHVNGNLKSEGLKELGLVNTVEEKGRVAIKISTLGRLLLKGYVKSQ